MNRAARNHLLEAAALCLIFALATFLRFSWLGVSSFAGDEARISLDALRLLDGEFVYIAQPSSTGVPFFPASVWMFIPPFALSSDPLLATLYISLLSLLTVLGVWALGRQWSIPAGLIAALFLATSPYAVFYGRSIWQPNLLPALGLLWFTTAYLAVMRSGRPRLLSIAANIFLSAFVVQVHFAGAAFLLGTLYAGLRWRWWRQWKAVMGGGALAALAMLPYVYYLLTQDRQILERLGSVGGASASIDLSAARHLLHLALGVDWGYLALGDYDTFSRQPFPILLAAALVGLGGLALIRLGLRIRRAAVPVDVRTRTLAELLIVWLLISPLFFLRHTTPVLPHYLLIALPGAALLAGASATLSSKRAFTGALISMAIVLAAIWTTQIDASLARAARERPPQSALSSILSESRGAAAGFSDARAALFFTHGDDPALSGEAAVFRVLLWDHPDARVIDGTTQVILPPTPAVLMSTLAPFQAWEELVSAGLVTQAAEYPRRLGADPFTAVEYDGSAAPDGFTPVEPVALADGTQLEGWRVRQVGDRLRVSTLWRVSTTPATALQQFHHLYQVDSDGIGNRAPDYGSDVALSVHLWRPGDRVIVMADFFDLPAGRYALLVGRYRRDDGQRVLTAQSGETALPLGDFEQP